MLFEVLVGSIVGSIIGILIIFVFLVIADKFSKSR
jgi:hypothetical protein